MTKKKYITAIALLFVIFLVGFIIINTARLDTLEKDIVVTPDIKVEAVGQYTFGKGGLVLVGQSKSGDGVFKAYTKIPVIDRYMETLEIPFSDEDQPLYIAVESWEGYQAMTFHDGEFKIESKPTGAGFAGRIPLWITLSALASFLIVYVPNRLQRGKAKSEKNQRD